MAAISAMDCQICLQNMVGRSPRALPCLHTFCESCLVSLQSEQVSQNPSGYSNPQYAYGPSGYRAVLVQEEVQEDDPSHPPPSNPYPYNYPSAYNPYQGPISSGRRFVPQATQVKIACPICRKQAKLPSGGVKALPINFMISQMKDLHVENEKTRKCQLCKKEQAIHACETCVKHLCGKCKDQHEGVPAFLSHNVRRLKVAKQCKKHHSDAIYVCTTCALQICVECVMCDNHQAHKNNIIDYETWITSEREELKQLQSHLKPKLSGIQAELREMKKYQENIQETLSSVNKSASQAKQQIEADYKAITKQLTEKRHSISDVIKDLEKVFTEADKICSVEEEHLDINSIVSSFIKVKSRGKAVQESMTKLSRPTVAWFTFTPERVRSLGTLETLQDISDMKVESSTEEALLVVKGSSGDGKQSQPQSKELGELAMETRKLEFHEIPASSHPVLAWSETKMFKNESKMEQGVEHYERFIASLQQKNKRLQDELRTIKQQQTQEQHIANFRPNFAGRFSQNTPPTQPAHFVPILRPVVQPSACLYGKDTTDEGGTCPNCGEVYSDVYSLNLHFHECLGLDSLT